MIDNPGADGADRPPGDAGGWLSGACLYDEPETALAERLLLRPHLPDRTTWLCTADGLAWPCSVARFTLRTHMSDTALRKAMALFCHEAAWSPTGRQLDGSLYDQFYRWIGASTQERAVGCASVPTVEQPPT